MQQTSSSTAGFSNGQRISLEAKLKRVFTPHAPVADPDLFSGRLTEIRAVTDTITHAGLHAVIYGERGVGKTSLASIIIDLLAEVPIMLSRVNCAQGTSFSSVIRGSLAALRFEQRKTGPGFVPSTTTNVATLVDHLPEGDVLPDEAASLLASWPGLFVLVIDEFDRVSRKSTTAFADFIKSLSDRGAETTIVLVGVANDINDLLAGHASIERCLRQIRMPRMSDGELRQILEKGFSVAGFEVESEAVFQQIVSVSQGFPHYSHLLGLNSARAAIDSGSMVITQAHVLQGIRTAVEFADQSHRELYHKAVTGTKKQNIWTEVVTACAIAESDERGFFASRAVQDSLGEILNREVIQQTVAFHLGKLTEPSRGPLLLRTGPERRYRYSFVNPMMRPFIAMKAIGDGLIDSPIG